MVKLLHIYSADNRFAGLGAKIFLTIIYVLISTPLAHAQGGINLTDELQNGTCQQTNSDDGPVNVCKDASGKYKIFSIGNKIPSPEISPVPAHDGGVTKNSKTTTRKSDEYQSQSNERKSESTRIRSAILFNMFNILCIILILVLILKSVISIIHSKRMIRKIMMFFTLLVLVIILLCTVVLYLQNPADRACNLDWKKCADNIQMVNNLANDSEVKDLCKESVKKQILYGDVRYSQTPFNKFPVGKDFIERGKVDLFDEEAQIQNQFGAWQHVVLFCEYDLSTKDTVSIINP